MRVRSQNRSHDLRNEERLPLVVNRQTSLVTVFVDSQGSYSLEARPSMLADLGVMARVSKTMMEANRLVDLADLVAEEMALWKLDKMDNM